MIRSMIRGGKPRFSVPVALLAALVLGMSVTGASQDNQPFLGVRTVVNGSGTQVVGVLPGSPAETAGLRTGDVIIAVNDVTVSAAHPLDTVIGQFHPGAQVQITVIRSGNRLQLSVTLGVRSDLQTAVSTGAATQFATGSVTETPSGTPTPAPAAVTIAPATAVAGTGGFLGVRLVTTAEGVRVAAVLPAGPADAAGIRAGDLIAAVDNAPVTTAPQVQMLLDAKRPGESITLQIRRGDSTMSVTVRLAPRPIEAPSAMPPVLVTPPAPAPPISLAASFPNLGFRTVIEPNGLRVMEVIPNSPAQRGDLRAGDIIASVDDFPFSVRDITPLIARLLTSPRPRLIVMRGGQRLTIQLAQTPVVTPTPILRGGRLGITYDVVTPTMAADRHLSVDYGALVLDVAANSPADMAGIKPGDVITAVDGDKVDAKRTLAIRMAPYTNGDVVTLTVVRGTETRQIQVTLAGRGAAVAPNGVAVI
jgi:S1-C subfamily serine protease